MNATALEFINRLPEGAKAERDLVATAFRFPEAVRTKAAAVRADKNLSDVGRAAALRKLVSEGGMAEHFGQVKAQAKTWQAEIQNARAAMKPKAPDKSDLTAAVQHMEIRSYLRALKDGERMRVAFEPEFAQAVAGAPPALSGLPKDVYEKVVEAAIERELGPRVEALRQREQIVETVTAALKTAEGKFAVRRDLHPEKTSNDYASPIYVAARHRRHAVRQRRDRTFVGSGRSGGLRPHD